MKHQNTAWENIGLINKHLQAYGYKEIRNIRIGFPLQVTVERVKELDSLCNANVWLMLFPAPTGTFKIIDALVYTQYALENLSLMEKGGIVCSSGNTARAVAYCFNHLKTLGIDLPLTVVVPRSGWYKLEKELFEGHELIQFDGNLEEARKYATSYAEKHGRIYFAPLDVKVAAYTTLAFAINRFMISEDVFPDCVYQTVSGGASVAGMAEGFESLGKDVRICTVQPDDCSPICDALSEDSSTILNREYSTSVIEPTLGSLSPNDQYARWIYPYLKKVGGYGLKVAQKDIDDWWPKLRPIFEKYNFFTDSGDSNKCFQVEKSGILSVIAALKDEHHHKNIVIHFSGRVGSIPCSCPTPSLLVP